MSKIRLSAMGLLPETEQVTVNIGEAAVTVTPRIPYEQFLDMIQWCVNFIIDDRPFISEPMKGVVRDIAIVKYYTNFDISFMDLPTFETKVLFENYDLLVGHNAIALIKEALDQHQLAYFEMALDKTLQSIVDYRNSAQGIVDQLAINADENTNAMKTALTTFSDPDTLQNVEGLMQMVEKLGMPQA